MSLKIVTIIGARPQFIKAAAVSKAFIEAGIEEIIVHSGQHYDANMSDVFWDELGIPKTKHHLNVGSASHANQTAQIMIKFEEVLLNQEKGADAVMVYGDTNTTLAVALVASKLQIPIIHVEAGLRSFNRAMPEEINRILTDCISELLFCSSEVSIRQLEKEGVEGKAVNTGDVMYDAFQMFSQAAKGLQLTKFNAQEPFSLFTLHRQSNTVDVSTVNGIISQLSAVPNKVIWPIHPRILKWKEQMNLPDNVEIVEPLSYMEMLKALDLCETVFTDSGGLQKEAYWAKKQCFTFRNDTEWVETLEGGWNTLIKEGSNDFAQALSQKPSTPWKPIYGTGKASAAIAETIKSHFQS